MNKKKIILLAALAALIAAFFVLDGSQYLTLESLRTHRDTLFASYEANRAVFLITYVGLYIAVVTLSLPGGAIMTLAGGAIFGALVGTGAVLVGATIGATLAFLLARYLLHDAVQKRLGDRLAKLDEGFSKDGLNYMLFLRLVPLFPFFLINLGAGLTKLPLRTYFIGTALGIAPGTFVFANAGANLARIDTLKDILSPGVLGAFALLGLFALVPTVVQKVRKNKKAAGG